MKKPAILTFIAFTLQLYGAASDADEKQAILAQARSKIGKTEINPLFPSLEDDDLSPILTVIRDVKAKYSDNETDQKFLEETRMHYSLRQHKTGREVKDLGECNLYKIHLMPNTYNLEFVYDIVKLMETDEALKDALSYKILKPSFYRKNQPLLHATEWGDKEIVADVVIYFEGKERAQAGLNHLYRATNHIQGSGFRPRYNAQVNDFIWAAQGNADNKYRGKRGYDENVIWCSYPETVNQRLSHPETGEDLISFTEKPITDDMLTDKDTQANLSEDDFNTSAAKSEFETPATEIATTLSKKTESLPITIRNRTDNTLNLSVSFFRPTNELGDLDQRSIVIPAQTSNNIEGRDAVAIEIAPITEHAGSRRAIFPRRTTP